MTNEKPDFIVSAEERVHLASALDDWVEAVRDDKFDPNNDAYDTPEQQQEDIESWRVVQRILWRLTATLQAEADHFDGTVWDVEHSAWAQYP
jgi:thiamine kinase-like enzyme